MGSEKARETSCTAEENLIEVLVGFMQNELHIREANKLVTYSLMNVDIKIRSKAIARRLGPILPELIHHNQSGSINLSNIKF